MLCGGTRSLLTTTTFAAPPGSLLPRERGPLLSVVQLATRRYHSGFVGVVGEDLNLPCADAAAPQQLNTLAWQRVSHRKILSRSHTAFVFLVAGK